jgi:hypothetical protein
MAAKKKTEKARKPRRTAAPRRPRGVARRPILRLTFNGQVVATIIGPRGANDLRIIWGFPLLGGGGYFTQNGREIPKTRFIFLENTNDFHFSPTGRFRKGGVPLRPPEGANDIEIIWNGAFITHAWWTRNGERFEEIPIEPGTGDISVDWS